jgi:hypothetical protein
MGVVRLSHPNEEDCKNVLSWVKSSALKKEKSERAKRSDFFI